MSFHQNPVIKMCPSLSDGQELKLHKNNKFFQIMNYKLSENLLLLLRNNKIQLAMEI
jgi:hypothetical protein